MAKKGNRLLPNIQNEMFMQSGLKNNALFSLYWNKLTNIAISLIRWENLPDGIDARKIEYYLYMYGKIIFFRDEIAEQYCCLPFISNGGFDNNGYPVRRTAYSPYNNYRYPNLTAENSVIIYDNLMKTTPKIELLNYIQKLYHIDNVIDVNLNAQKTPILLECDEKQKQTLLNMYQQYDGNRPVIMGYKNADLGKKITAITTGAPYLVDKLNEYKQNVYNEFLTSRGVVAITESKKERMIVSEISSMNGGAYAARLSEMGARETGVGEINKKFNLNIDVEFIDYITQTENNGGVENV